MRLTFDRAGFPMIMIRGVGAFHLWPVTKFQFRQFMAETDRYGEAWYAGPVGLNGPVEPDACTGENVEKLFITGIRPSEALDFARWLGEDYDLPTEEEWCEFYRTVEKQYFNLRLSPYGLCPEAVALGKRLGAFLRKPLRFTFLNDGIVEWVKTGEDYAGRGAPRDSFFPNVWNPLDDSIKIISKEERVFYFGCRLIRRYPERFAELVD